MLATLTIPALPSFRKLLYQRKQPAAITAQFYGLLTQTDSSRVIGLEYLRPRPDEADIGELVEHLFADDTLRDRFFSSRIQEKRRIIGGMTQQDFKHSRTVSVNGWVLSQTEARLFAINSLI